jgi:hypothetical protein
MDAQIPDPFQVIGKNLSVVRNKQSGFGAIA